MKDEAGPYRIAVLLPCRNEGSSIRRVVREFAEALPTSTIYVYDNSSDDQTMSEARAAGAVVRKEPMPGKGNVVKRMFSDVDADIYVIADGDGTYEAAAAPRLLDILLSEQVDMVIGTRDGVFSNAYRPGHAMGNRLFNSLFTSLFGRGFSDIFSGYRVLSRRFVKTFPCISEGFEIEAEMSVHATQLRIPIAETATSYRPRGDGSASKLRTYHDAARILWTLTLLFKEVRPIRFYGSAALLISLLGVVLAIPLVTTYIETGLVPRFPTAILVMGLMLISTVCMVCGLILDSVARGRLEQKRIAYLSTPPLSRSIAE